MARRKRPEIEDEAQSRRFLDLARELEADGDLDINEGERGLDALVRKARDIPLPETPTDDPSKNH